MNVNVELGGSASLKDSQLVVAYRCYWKEDRGNIKMYVPVKFTHIKSHIYMKALHKCIVFCHKCE